MKFLRIILVIILLVGLAYPCVDTVSLSEIIVLTNESTESQNEAEDNCSPFCMCACCSFSYSVEKVIQHNNLSTPGDAIIVYNNTYLLKISCSIRQPPKIS